MNAKINLITSKNTWIEGEAIRQLNQTAELEGVVQAVGLPDLHPGRGHPVGAAFIIQGAIYPYLIGNDVGCGVALFATNLKRNKIKRDRWAKKLKGLERPYEGDLDVWREKFGIEPSLADAALGAIGGGNHFAELQMIDKVLDADGFEALGLNKKELMLVVHSGSRGLGNALLRSHTDVYGTQGLSETSPEARAYLTRHDAAIQWAACNRALIAHRFASLLGAASRPVLDACHNSITPIDHPDGRAWLHRKGAAPSHTAGNMIPGSRGDLSYLVKPLGDQGANAESLPHGAGRKWNRGSCKGRLRKRYNAKALLRTPLGGVVICEDKNLLYEEAPQAYKKIDTVIQALVENKLAAVIATFKPIITYKTRKGR